MPFCNNYCSNYYYGLEKKYEIYGNYVITNCFYSLNIMSFANNWKKNLFSNIHCKSQLSKVLVVGEKTTFAKKVA